MSTVPRRPRPGPEDRAQTILTQTRGAQSGQGSAATARPVDATRLTRQYVPPAVSPVTVGRAGSSAVSIAGTTDNPDVTSTVAGNAAVAIGWLATAANTAVSIGPDSSASGGYAVRIGFAGNASNSNAVGIGTAVNASGDSAVGMGYNAVASGEFAVAIGRLSSAAAQRAVAVGNAAVASEFSVAIGQGASAVDTGGALNVAVGDQALHANTSGDANTAVGQNALLSLIDGSDNTGIGQRALINVQHGQFNTGLGHNAGPASGNDPDYSTSIGELASASANGSVAIGTDSGGNGAATTTANEIALGTGNHATIIAGKLVIADGSGGLHQIVVSTGGALSTVAYP